MGTSAGAVDSLAARAQDNRGRVLLPMVLGPVPVLASWRVGLGILGWARISRVERHPAPGLGLVRGRRLTRAGARLTASTGQRGVEPQQGLTTCTVLGARLTRVRFVAWRGRVHAGAAASTGSAVCEAGLVRVWRQPGPAAGSGARTGWGTRLGRGGTAGCPGRGARQAARGTTGWASAVPPVAAIDVAGRAGLRGQDAAPTCWLGRLMVGGRARLVRATWLRMGPGVVLCRAASVIRAWLGGAVHAGRVRRGLLGLSVWPMHLGRVWVRLVGWAGRSCRVTLGLGVSRSLLVLVVAWTVLPVVRRAVSLVRVPLWDNEAASAVRVGMALVCVAAEAG